MRRRTKLSLIVFAILPLLALPPSALHSQQIETWTSAPVRMIHPEGLVTANHAVVERRFAIEADYGARFEYDFRVTRPGIIRLVARWEGEAEALALILNGPEQVAAYARQDGPSPLVIELEVDENLVHRGDDWTASVVNFTGARTEDGVGRLARGWLLVQHPTELDWRVRPVEGGDGS